MFQTDQKYMVRALELAKMAMGRTNPNPMVGAVVVKNDQIIGEGYHHKAGTPHAEIHALREAGKEAEGATVYVSLEPCSHYGKTPPCADALIAAGVKRVVVAMIDPNPKVAGRGIEKLQNAGIDVTVGVMEEEAVRLNEIFLKHIKTEMPFIALKTAMSLDGKIACQGGDSKWITAATARHYVHILRNTYDAILAGIGTVLKDDPLLNTRLPENEVHNPIRVIIDTFLDLPEDSQIVTTAQEIRTIVFCSQDVNADKEDSLLKKGIEIIKVPGNDNVLPLEKVFSIMYKNGICSVLVEGGGEINGYLIRHQLIDKFYLFVGAKIIGGTFAPGPVGGEGIKEMSEAMPMIIADIQRYGDDVLMISYPRKID